MVCGDAKKEVPNTLTFPNLTTDLRRIVAFFGLLGWRHPSPKKQRQIAKVLQVAEIRGIFIPPEARALCVSLDEYSRGYIAGVYGRRMGWGYLDIADKLLERKGGEDNGNRGISDKRIR